MSSTGAGRAFVSRQVYTRHTIDVHGEWPGGRYRWQVYAWSEQQGPSPVLLRGEADTHQGAIGLAALALLDLLDPGRTAKREDAPDPAAVRVVS